MWWADWHFTSEGRTGGNLKPTSDVHANEPQGLAAGTNFHLPRRSLPSSEYQLLLKSAGYLARRSPARRILLYLSSMLTYMRREKCKDGWFMAVDWMRKYNICFVILNASHVIDSPMERAHNLFTHSVAICRRSPGRPTRGHVRKVGQDAFYTH